MAISSKCEALALEISYLMPNQRAVEAASRFARTKRCTALAEKLNDVMLEKANEVIEEAEEEEQFEYRASPSKNSVVLMEKNTGPNQCRPKPVRLGKRATADSDDEPSFTASQFIDDNSNTGDGESSNFRSKTIVPAAKKSGLNPFKIAAAAGQRARKQSGSATASGSSKQHGKSKRNRPASDEENEDDSDDDTSNTDAVVNFFINANKNRLEDENPDVDEDDLRMIARDEYDSLPVGDRREWMDNMEQPLKRAKAKKVRV